MHHHLGPLKSDLGVFWPFRATDFIMGILKIWDNFLGPNGPILKFTFLESLRNLWLFGINKKDGCFFRFRTPSRHMCSDCSFSTHFVSQSSYESPGPCPHLRARVKNAHPQINDQVRVNREWWRRRNLPSSQSAVAALSSRGRGNPAPQEVSLQFQSFKVFSQSFKVPIAQTSRGNSNSARQKS